MAKTEIKKNAIWWAVDPFHDEDSFHEHAIKVLVPIARALSTVIYPVTFIDTYRALEPLGQKFPLLPVESEPIELLKKIAIDRINLLTKKAQKGIFGSPIILSQEDYLAPSLRERVDAISSAAQKHSSLFVALHSHTHKGFKRFYMGSFAETYMLYSKTPMLLFNPKCLVSTKIKKVVFATDFSIESINACNTVQKMCLKIKAHLTIAHVKPWFLTVGISDSIIRKESEVLKESIVDRLDILTNKAKKLGLKSSGEVINGSENVSTSILKFSQKNNADIIALTAQSGPTLTKLIGATSRSVIRDAHCPVLVLRMN